MMPVGTHDRLATMGDIEPAVVNHALEAELLNRVALAVHPWPLAHFESLLDLRGAPVHQGFVRRGLDNHKVTGIIFAARFPRPTIDSCPILQGVHQSGLKAPEPRMLVVI